MTTDEKWEIAKPYYEKFYKVKINKRPTDLKINFLYEEMMKLTASIAKIYQEARPSVLKFLDPR